MNDKLPTETPKNADTGIEVADGELNYPSAAESGHVEIELPSLPGSPNSTERLHVRDFGPFVVGKIEARMKQQGYLKSGVQASPGQIFRHYTGAVKGYGLLDEAAIGRMESLASEFDETAEPAEFFEQVVKPYLYNLTPKRRG